MPEITANIKIEKDLWQSFKTAAKSNDSDASKEIRKFIKSYVRRHGKRKQD